MLNTICVELVELIAKSLDDRKDLLALRCVSRYLSNATFPVFAKAWFTRLDIDFTPRCYRRLVGITRSQELTDAVRWISVNACDRFATEAYWLHEDDEFARYLGQGYSWPRCEDNSIDLSSQQLMAFQSVIASFSHVKDIGVTNELGEGINMEGLTPMDACYIMLSFLQRNVKNRIQTFTIDFWQDVASYELVTIPPRIADLLVQTTWSSQLQHLDIWWAVTDGHVNPTVDLISTAMSARSMDIGFPHSAGDTVFQRLIQIPQLPTLAHLTISVMGLYEPDLLTRFIARFQRSLKTLCIQKLIMHAENVPVFYDLLAELDLPALELIVVKRCRHTLFCSLPEQQDVLERCGGRFNFARGYDEILGRDVVYGVQYRGSGEGMRLALRAIADHLTDIDAEYDSSATSDTDGDSDSPATSLDGNSDSPATSIDGDSDSPATSLD
ncbi:hypothetical protein GGR54DRAFT_423540 [Hypoxylon sp. NC1633]|nr:hypothetical protein GGR54DRAFT_423540 [Hypoxylon sp. NC1633]